MLSCGERSALVTIRVRGKCDENIFYPKLVVGVGAKTLS